MNSITLSKRWKDHLSNLPESGMGHQIVEITLGNNSKIISTVLNGTYLLTADETLAENDIVTMEIAKNIQGRL